LGVGIRRVDGLRDAGADRAACRSVKPDIVYCSISGYGQTGPEAVVRAYDTMAQAAAGLMTMTGDPGGAPMRAGAPLADTIAGTFAFAGILAALLHRSRSGEGQHIDVSMVDCLLSLALDESPDVWQALGLPARHGNRLPRASPFNVYPTADGWIAAGAASDAEWSRLLDAIDRADLKGDPNFMSQAWRLAHNDRVDAVVAAWTREPRRSRTPDICGMAGQERPLGGRGTPS
jgi:crotonobetainyl-CoA:carnitine CoA-transferase CaiB-like acyl-CoA transferase